MHLSLAAESRAPVVGTLRKVEAVQPVVGTLQKVAAAELALSWGAWCLLAFVRAVVAERHL